MFHTMRILTLLRNDETKSMIYHRWWNNHADKKKSEYSRLFSFFLCMHLRIKSYRSQLGRWGPFRCWATRPPFWRLSLREPTGLVLEEDLFWCFLPLGLVSHSQRVRGAKNPQFVVRTYREGGRDHPVKMHVSGHEKLRHKAKRSTPTSALWCLGALV